MIGMERGRRFERWAALVALPLAAHGVLSGIGFNPTDDGFVLAGSARLLWGQVPHRDFLSIRPPGSYYLHLPEVWLGGEWTFRLSRLVAWGEWGITGWAWSGLAEWAGGTRFLPGSRLAISVIASVFCAHQFPPMAWHSIDAVTLASAGLLLIARGGGIAAPAGAALLGFAALCRQNVLPMLPLALLSLPAGRSAHTVAGGMAPFLIYGLMLAVTGSVGAAVEQLSARTGLLEPGVLAWAGKPAVWVALILGAGAGWTGRRHAGVFAPGFAASLTALCTLGLARGELHGPASFALVAAAAGLAVTAESRWRIAAVLAAALGWCASISVGYNTPALGCGAAGALLLGFGGSAWPKGAHAYRVALVVLAVLAGAAMYQARHRFVYRDLPADLQYADLGPVFPGGRGIRTNAETAALLADLRVAIATAGSTRYAVIPDLAAHWVRADRPNPLFADWPFTVELSNPKHFLRVLDDFHHGRGKLVVIIQKYRADVLPQGRVAFSGVPYDIVDLAKRMLTKTGETEFFELYR